MDTQTPSPFLAGDPLFLLGQIHSDVRGIRDRLEEELAERKALEDRVASLEVSRAKDRSYILGASAVLSAVIAAVGPFVHRLFPA